MASNFEPGIERESENELMDFKIWYRDLVLTVPNGTELEAEKLGINGRTVRNYKSVGNDTSNLPLALAHLSLFNRQHVERLAKKCGGIFVPFEGKTNGTSADELAAILKACSELQVETDSKKRAKAFKSIAVLATRAAEEENN